MAEGWRGAEERQKARERSGADGLRPADYNTTAAVIERVYQTQGQIWTLVVPKVDSIPELFTTEEARRLLQDGGCHLEWASYNPDRARIILTAVGAYQLVEVLKASFRLAKRGIEHAVVYMLEPGRFRTPRSDSEHAHMSSRQVCQVLYPGEVPARLFLTHTRPEALLGVLSSLHTGPQTVGLGYTNHGGTLNTGGMLFVNRCTWAHCLAEVARLLRLTPEEVLTAEEIAALAGQEAPAAIITKG